MSHSNADLYFETSKEEDKVPGSTSFVSKKKVKGGSFESFNLSKELFQAIKKKGYNMPTPI
jgi:superfamily II DNA/RNA helicase